MPKYDQSLDKELFSDAVEFEKTKITVAVMAYNEGQPKLQITRQNKNAEKEFSFTKLGRISKDELNSILPLIEKAKKHL